MMRADRGAEATNVPFALATQQDILCRDNSSIALRTVPWLTPKRAARSCSLGIACPGAHSPASSACKIRLLICWAYKGLNVGDTFAMRDRIQA